MVRPSIETQQLAIQLTEDLASASLPPIFAKLYSQHTRLRESQPGLNLWGDQEAIDRLNDALRILEAAFVEREAESEVWRNSMRRVGEILEWLSHSEMNLGYLPSRFLAAAAYQLAGYPARAAGLLNDDDTSAGESDIVGALLRASFPNLLHSLAEYWANEMTQPQPTVAGLPWGNPDSLSVEIHRWVVSETASALGILCAAMRWGNEARFDMALDKLSSIAKVLIHGNTPYSWLLARLSAEVASNYWDSSLRNHLTGISNQLNQSGKLALEQYLRQSYQTNRALAWPSQIKGIERLTTGESFALCTPTGSGKTAVAEVAILQSLFSERRKSEDQVSGIEFIQPLAVYLVPSRALAAEVEAKLSRVLRRVEEPVIVVTGLYGGTDWGPTDFWLTTEERTILICTYEKAEALLRFIGPVFLSRISLIVIDEAHKVEFDGNEKNLRDGESRSLRLESLITRLLNHLDDRECRVVALSAVAAGIEDEIAKWVTGRNDATPAKHAYRSTRQLIGRLECLPDGRSEILYDLLDGASLEFQEGDRRDRPYIPNAFPPHPPVESTEWKGPEKQLRPYLFWAAINLAAMKNKRQQRSVLISITQGIGGYAKDFLKLLDETWKEETLPVFFQEPTDGDKLETWQNCLRSCADYFGDQSSEYRLLQRGIIIHHGKMPGSMARLLVRTIEDRIVHLVVATSTLSEGVNLPFETVLIPALRRSGKTFGIREFSNLAGRAGRPGYGTEGRSLVLFGGDSGRARQKYLTLVDSLSKNKQSQTETGTSSPLAALLLDLEEQWRNLANSQSRTEFLGWLEQIEPINTATSNEAIDAVDALDSILLAAIVEIEQIEGSELSSDQLEEKLKQVWQHSYAHCASAKETELSEVFLRRGKTLKSRIYPDRLQRRRLYRTSLPPRSGNQVINLYPAARQLLVTGREYGQWDKSTQFEYVRKVVELIQTLPRFGLAPAFTKKAKKLNSNWALILHWWLDPKGAPEKPEPSEVTEWHDFISQNFYYRFNWGLGSILALAIDETFGQEIRVPTIEDWKQTGLPWIALWLKELIVWGTLDPVAAYLLAKVPAIVTRKDAESFAQEYYQGQNDTTTPDELLNPAKILEWTKKFPVTRKRLSPAPQAYIKANLLRDFSGVPPQQWRVLPVEVSEEIRWTDPAGFPLASSNKPDNWQTEYSDVFDFFLDPANQIVISTPYFGTVFPA